MEHLHPDDFSSLLGIARQLNSDLRLVENNTTEPPKDSSGFVRAKGSKAAIIQGLEQAKQLVQAPTAHNMGPPTGQPYMPDIPTAVPQEVPHFPDIPPNIPYTHDMIPNVPMVEPNIFPQEAQLELNFNKSEQQKTNELLTEISKKLSKVIDLLQKSDKVVKLDAKKQEETKVR